MTGPNPEATRLLLVDDDALVRAGLRLILGGHADLQVIAEASDGLAGVALARDLRPDVVLMDVRMPRMDGLAATTALVSDPCPPRIIVLTTFDADELVLGALAAGAAGFLLKDTPPASMVESIRAVARGENTLSPSVMAQVISAATARTNRYDQKLIRRQKARSRIDALTEREREVARSIAAGLSNADIASSLFMSVATVKGHVGNIFDKLGTSNRVQVAVLVHQAELD